MNINKEIAQQVAKLQPEVTFPDGYQFMSTEVQTFKVQYRFVIAVSGGPDSQALLKAFPHVVGKGKCLAVGVNHGLRPEADAELDLAEKLAQDVGIGFERIRIKLRRGGNLMARAREARYKALYKAADDFSARFVVCAHHSDDRAETVLIRLLRGRGAGSLAVLPAVSGRLFRPLLRVSRQDIMGYLKRWNVSYANDPSNKNTDFLRVWVRKELLPMMESKNPKIRERLNELSDELQSLGGSEPS